MSKILKVNPLDPQPEYIKEAAETIKQGGLVIIPTETVYGIAANMLNSNTIERLYTIKGRPKEKLFTLHLDSKEKIDFFSKDIPVAAWKLINKFWPGPLTLVLKAKEGGTIGLRMPDDDVALRVIGLSGVPVVCPSANLNGKPAPKNFEEAIIDLGESVDLALDAGKTKLGVESTVVDLTSQSINVLREGLIKKEEIEKIAQRKTVLFVCTGNSCRSVMAKAILEDIFKKAKRFDVEVISAGIMSSGSGATEATIEVLAREGIDVSGHRAQKITQEMLKKSDLILVMEKLQEERIKELAPVVKNRVFLLKEFAKIESEDLNIDDPIGRPIDVYEETLRVIKEAVERISKII